VASFDRRGNYIFTGNTKGRVMVLTCPELKIKASFKVTQGTSSATAVKSIEFARRGEYVLLFTICYVACIEQFFENTFLIHLSYTIAISLSILQTGSLESTTAKKS